MKTGAAQIIDIKKINGGSIAIAGHTPTVVYTESFGLPQDATFAFALKAASGGSVKLVIELESSVVEPATEKAADSNFVIPDGKSAIIADLTDEIVHVVAYSPVATKFARLKISSGVGNDASTVLDIAKLSYILK